MTTSGELPWLTEAGLQTLNGGYLLDGETPLNLFERVAKSASSQLKRGHLYPYFLEAMNKNWLCLATPVAANLGTDRALPISCYGINVQDSVFDIYNCNTEMAMLTQKGGGVGLGLSNIRARGTPIRGGGISEGTIPWAHLYDTGIEEVNQAGVRRGAASVNLGINHGDTLEFLRIRRAIGDARRQCLNLNHAVIVDDSFMESIVEGNAGNRSIWKEVLRARIETGEPYIMFIDNVNKHEPKQRPVSMTNICSEITLYNDAQHSFVCCLSSLNLSKWDEWKDYKFENGMTLPELGIWFLDSVMEEFINNAKGKDGFDKVVRFAEKSRALGLGALGWHTYLQSHGLPFDTSVEVMGLNHRIFKFIKEEADNASMEIGIKNGIPEWGIGRRNSHLTALAPTLSNAIISGGVSASIEPISANAYTQKTAKGVFLYKNPTLERILVERGKNTTEVWKDIVANEGSVQQLDFLSAGQREVFLTAREINQFHLVRQAEQRQPFIDQSQSLNLFFPVNVEGEWFNKIHVEAWKAGIKSLYYCQSGSILKSDIASRFYDESCTACEG